MDEATSALNLQLNASYSLNAGTAPRLTTLQSRARRRVVNAALKVIFFRRSEYDRLLRFLPEEQQNRRTSNRRIPKERGAQMVSTFDIRRS